MRLRGNVGMQQHHFGSGIAPEEQENIAVMARQLGEQRWYTERSAV